MYRLTNIKELNESRKGTLVEALNIEFTAFEHDQLQATMEVTTKHHQPMGIMHGGASAVLAETVGNALSILCIKDGEISVGYHLSVHHLKQVSEGKLFAKASFIKKGKHIHLIQIQTTDEVGDLVSHATLQCQILEAR